MSMYIFFSEGLLILVNLHLLHAHRGIVSYSKKRGRKNGIKRAAVCLHECRSLEGSIFLSYIKEPC